MKRMFLLILILPVIVQAADTELQDMVELTAVVATDILYILDDPTGTPASRKITALNLFDLIDTYAELNAIMTDFTLTHNGLFDTFSELNTIVADKTLVNEEDAVTWDALGTFGLGITITTGDPFILGTTRWDNGSDLIDGERIANDTIDNDSIDWGDMTDLTTDGAVVWGNITAGELADDTVNDDDINWGDITYLTTDGAGINETYASGWNADVGPPEKDDIYDYLHQIDADDDGSLVDESWYLTQSNTIDFSGATLTMPKRTKNDDRFYSFNAWNPNALYDTDTQICFEPNLPAAITITEVTITLDADPTTELDWDLKWADAFIGLGTATLIVAIDTTNGTTDVDSGWNDATVEAGKCLYIEMAADPDSNIKQAIVKIRYDFD